MITFNIFTGNFDYVGSSSSTPSTEDGSALNPFTGCNIKWAMDGFYYLIKEYQESVVTNNQRIDGILILDGVNTIL